MDVKLTVCVTGPHHLDSDPVLSFDGMHTHSLIQPPSHPVVEAPGNRTEAAFFSFLTAGLNGPLQTPSAHGPANTLCIYE